MKKIFLAVAILVGVLNVNAQDKNFAQGIMKNLSSFDFYGRGYNYDGINLAAEFIAQTFEENGIEPYGGNYFQDFKVDVNTIEDVSLKVDNRQLKDGNDYTVSAFSKSTNGIFSLIHLDEKTWNSEKKLKKFIKKNDLTNKVVVIDGKYARDLKYRNLLGAKGVLFITDWKPMFQMSLLDKPQDYFVLSVTREALGEEAKTISINIKSRFKDDYKIKNVIGFVQGTEIPDSFLVVTAHYDHLGMMGKNACFYGANDNASGTSMIIDFARHYTENPPKYSMLFIACAGEEIGLKGSKYFVANPIIDLEKIKFLINFDMVGSGSDGITLVNGSALSNYGNRIVEINNSNEYVSRIKLRGEAANSDHFPFYDKGVPAFFIYSMGKECTNYHNVYDTHENTPFTEYEDIFILILNFFETF